MIRKIGFSFCLVLTLMVTSAAFGADVPEIFVQTGHSNSVSSIAFSPDGKYLASGGQDKRARIWEVETGRQVRTFLTGFTNQFSWIRSLAVSPDGKRLVAGGFAGDIMQWDIKTGRDILTIPVGGKYLSDAMSVAFSPDGSLIAAACILREDNNVLRPVIQLFSAKTGHSIKVISGHADTVSSIAFSPDGKYLVSGSGFLNKTGPDSTVRLWDVKTGRELQRFAGHSAGILQVAFSPDGRFVASSGADQNIILWDIRKKQRARTFMGQGKNAGGAIAFSPDGRYVVSAARSCVTLWDVARGEAAATLKDERISDDAVSVSPDSRYLAVSAGEGILLWNIASRQKIRTLGGNVNMVHLSHFSADQERIHILESIERKTFDVASGLPRGGRPVGFVFAERFYDINEDVSLHSYDDRFYAKGYRLIDGNTDRVITRSADAVSTPDQSNPVAFSSDGRYVIAPAKNFDAVTVLDTKNARMITLENIFPEKKYFGVKGEVSPDGRYAAVWMNKRIGIYRLSGQKAIVQMDFEGIIQTAVFTADGRSIAVAGRVGADDDDIRLFDVESGGKIRTFSGHHGSITTLCLSADGRSLLSGDWLGNIKLWNFDTGEEIRTFTGHLDILRSAVLSRDNRRVLSSSADGTTRLWDASTGRELAQFISFSDKEWIVITPEGYFNASPGGARHLNVRVGHQVYSIDNFYEKFFNPVYVASALQGKAVEGAADIRKGILFPPDVRITSPAPGSVVAADTLALTVAARDTGGGIEDIRLYHNGKAIGEDIRAVKLVSKDKETIKTYTVSLVDGDNTFRAVGFSRDRTESNPHELTVRLAAPSKSVSLYVLAVGINTYKNPALTLNYAQPDAQGIAGFFRKQGGGLFGKTDIREIYNEQATRDNILSRLRQLRNTQPQDAVLIYLAGHGESLGDKWYFIPHEVIYPEREEEVKIRGISSDELSGYIKNIRAQKVLLLVDACKSGAVMIAFRGFEDRKALSQLSRSTGVHVVAASTKDQFAAEVKDLGHGVFTYTLLEGLSGKAARPGEAVTVRRLMGYVEEQLPEITKKYKQEAQYPVVDSRGMDFPLVTGR